MTQRTEGLVTYTEETRVVVAEVKDAVQQRVNVAEARHHHRGNYSVYTTSNQGLTKVELRALRDAITVMLGDEDVSENATSNEAEESEDPVCENCGTEPPSAITADDVWLCKGRSASLNEEGRDRLASQRAGERIISRLEKVKSWTKDDFDSSPIVRGKHFGMDEAVAIVREECGVPQ